MSGQPKPMNSGWCTPYMRCNLDGCPICGAIKSNARQHKPTTGEEIAETLARDGYLHYDHDALTRSDPATVNHVAEEINAALESEKRESAKEIAAARELADNLDNMLTGSNELNASLQQQLAAERETSNQLRELMDSEMKRMEREVAAERENTRRWAIEAHDSATAAARQPLVDALKWYADERDLPSGRYRTPESQRRARKGEGGEMKVRDQRQEQLRDFGELFERAEHNEVFCNPKSGDIAFNRHKGNEQSTAAFHVIKAKISASQDRVLYYIRQAPDGITLDAIAEFMDCPPNAISGRVTELKRDGKIYKSGTRKTRSGCSAAILKAFS